MFCHRNSPVSRSGGGRALSQRVHQLRPQTRGLGQHTDASADVLAALGVVGGQGGHGVRPQLCPDGGGAVELRRADPETLRVPADLVERDQPGIPVEVAVLHGLGGHRPAQLLEPGGGFRVGQRAGQNLQWRSQFRLSGDRGGHRCAEGLRQCRVVAAVYPDGGQQRSNRLRQPGIAGPGGLFDRPAYAGQLTGEPAGGGVDLQLPQRFRGRRVAETGRLDQGCQGGGTGRVDENTTDLAKSVVPRGAVDRQRRV